MYLDDKKVAIYNWIDNCPEACFSYQEKDGTIIVEIKLEAEDEAE